MSNIYAEYPNANIQTTNTGLQIVTPSPNTSGVQGLQAPIPTSRFNISNTYLPNLDEAYSQYITTRNDNLFIVANEGGLTEEDVLCNTNLRTAGLFKDYMKELANLEEQYKILVQDQEDMAKSMVDIKKALGVIRHKTTEYHPSSADTLETNTILIDRSLGSVEFSIQNEILMRKSTLDAKIDTLTRKLNTIRTLIKTSMEDLIDKDSANNKKLCAICFDREVDMVMVPCGHTLCTGCSNYNTSNKCAHCRSVIQKRVKLFFS
jgi:hypothetical protein